MPGEAPPLLGATLMFMRLFSGWEQQELAAAHGMDGSRLSRLERSPKLTRERLEELVEPLEPSEGAIDRVLDCVREIRFGRSAPRSPEEEASWHLERAAARLAREAHEAARAEFGRYRADRNLEQERETAVHAWAHLRARPKKDWPVLVAGAREYQSWALCELVCAESERAAVDRAGDRALELARLAVRIAEATPGDEPARARLLGYANAHLASALAAEDLLQADRAFTAAKEQWKQGQKASLPLDPSRMLELEASLRRDQGRFEEASALLERALAMAPDERAACRILMKSSFCLEQEGRFEAAVEVLRQAAGYIGGPFELFALQFNLAVNLLESDRSVEAKELLPQLWESAGDLGNRLDLIRVRWLEAKLAAKLGREEEAVRGLEEVRQALAKSGSDSDTALSTLGRFECGSGAVTRAST